jgi:hypothetical protein
MVSALRGSPGHSGFQHPVQVARGLEDLRLLVAFQDNLADLSNVLHRVFELPDLVTSGRPMIKSPGRATKFFRKPVPESGPQEGSDGVTIPHRHCIEPPTIGIKFVTLSP